MQVYRRGRCFSLGCALVAFVGWIGGLGALRAVETYSVAEFMLHSRTRENGLPAGNVSAVGQAPDGYLWIGTSRGLARFDGIRFVTYTTNDTPSLGDNRITCLLVTRAGELWIGTASGTLVRRTAQTFAAVAFESQGRRINTLAEDNTGAVWVGTRGSGIARWQNDTWSFFMRTNGVPGAAQIVVDQAGLVWAVSGGKVLVFEGGKWIEPIAPGLLPNSARCLARAKDGGIWVGANADDPRGCRIFKVNRERKVEEVASYPWPQNTFHTSPQALFEDASGRLWVGFMSAGLYYLEPGRAWKSLAEEDAFSHILVNCITEDRAGSIWVGLNGAQLHQIFPRNVQTVQLPSPARQQAIRMACARRDGSVWVGTDGAGVFRYQHGKWTQFNEGLTNGYIGVIYEDRRTNLWVGTWDGLYRWDNDRFVPSLRANVPIIVRAMCEDREQNLWVGTTAGVARMNGATVKTYPGEEGYTATEILALEPDSEGTMWATAVGGGLFRLKSERFERVEPGPWPARAQVCSLLADSDGGMWIGSLDQGLAYMKDGRSAVWTSEDGLPSNEIRSIVADETGNLWCSSDNGIIGLNKQHLLAYKRGVSPLLFSWQLSVNDGLHTPQCSGTGQPIVSRSADGRLWVPNYHALAVFNPDRVPQTGAIYPPRVEELVVDGVRMAANHVRVPSSARRYEIHYSSPTLSMAERLRFRVRLKGWDNDWLDAARQRVAYYGRLPPGNYEFEVMAGGPTGGWQEAPTRLLLEVVPQVWERRSVQVAGGIGLFGVVGVTVWLATRARHRRKLAGLQFQNARESERRRIARDIHDSLGASLTRMALLGDMAGSPAQAQTHVQKVSTTAREMSQSLEAIVWAVRPENDTLRSLVDFLERRSEELFEGTAVELRFVRPREIPDSMVFAEARHNVFLACKEAMNNALKHAGASIVHVEVACTGGDCVVTIRDDGPGFNPKAIREGGNGLKNMQTRMEIIGGRYELSPNNGKGTIVRLAFPIHRSGAG